MSDLPAWLELGVAVIGLFAGGASGTYVGARLRFRLEDRRRLLNEVLPHLSVEEGVSVLRIQEYASNWDGDSVFDTGRYAAFRNAWAEARVLVRQLPWVDRVLWRRVEMAEQADDLEKLRLCTTVSALWLANVIVDKPSPELLEEASIALSSNSAATFEEKRVEFCEHLLRQVNPRMFDRFRRLSMILKLVREEQLPWNRQRSLARMPPESPFAGARSSILSRPTRGNRRK